jgi:sugar phosphate isomerase/epimerase
MNRREFIRTTGALSVLSALPLPLLRAQAGGRRMKVALTPGSIGVSVQSQQELNELAHRHRFEAVEPRSEELTAMSPGQLESVLADLPVDFRGADETFREGLKGLPRLAAGLQRAGVTRVGTWLMPNNQTLTYRQYFQQTTIRLREVATILKDHGMRLGLEYVGTQHLLVGGRYPFVHTLAETRELIAEIGTGNVGLVLDTWHWWTAGDTEADLASLTNADVVSVDLNDAPVGIEKAQQRDNRRELPLATGVIDIAPFVTALHRIGYDGPVRPEPFNQAVNAMNNDDACSVSSAALHKALGLIRS